MYASSLVPVLLRAFCTLAGGRLLPLEDREDVSEQETLVEEVAFTSLASLSRHLLNRSRCEADTRNFALDDELMDGVDESED